MKELASALSKAQAKITGAVKDSSNPFFKSKYADLSSVMDAIREPFAEHGLSYTQGGRYIDGQWMLVTSLMHSSGDEIQYYFPIICAKQNDPQAFGAAVSYARRFALSAIAGVSQVDDDGESAKAPKPQGSPIINENQRKRLFAICRENGWVEADLKAYINSIGIESTKDLTVKVYDEVCAHVGLNKKGQN